MSYGLSFTPDFFAGPDDEMLDYPVERPTTVRQALRSMSEDAWSEMATEVFGCPGDSLDPETVEMRIEETNTCSNLDVPVEVWIDTQGWYTIRVWDSKSPS